ncbi:tetratricopeptide repeat protein [Nonomuraea guangzhouensis]|uniref:Tetratricopeptide repeat protein n=1 Tax=Nonomuraea guangzhouensis TaxID=1291555 RepID=A0ABW4GMP4_9ACTN|nr:tetratricopeptide repeat protein [Nonomuraea guangzhouensis]
MSRILRIVVAAAGTVAVGVAVNQILNGGTWNWWALGASAGLAITAEGMNRWLAHREAAGSGSAPSSTMQPGSRVAWSVNVAGNVSGIIVSGDNATITQTHQTVLPPPTPIAAIDAPAGLGNLPLAAGEFVGREEILAQLDSAVGGDEPVVVAAVQGLGGIGKSTLAARYAALHHDRFHPVWWITADSPAALEAGLAALITALDPRDAEGVDLEARAERATVWLATHSGWLLILDNVTRPQDIAPLLGRVRSGRVVVTSRLRQGWQRIGARVLHLDVLSEDEAVDLLTRLAQPENPDHDVWPGALDLVRELGFLPLAIDQVGAYLHQTALTPAAYLTLLRAQPEVFFDQAAEGTDSDRTITRIWRITLNQLTDSSPLPGDLLRILAWMAPEAIPRTLLDALTSPRPGTPRHRWWQRTHHGWGTRPLTDQAGLTHALGLLAAYNMITLSSKTISVHRLVQAVARTPDTSTSRSIADLHRQPDQIATARDTATELLRLALPFDLEYPDAWPTAQKLLPHVTALTDHATPITDTITINPLLYRVGNFLRGQGALQQAITYLQRSVTLSERLHGPDHPNTLASRNDLAHTYQWAGDLDRAIPLLNATLADCERVLGPDHHNTLQTRSNLANAYREVGDFDRAIPLLETTLAHQERLLGANHPDTLNSRNNLAIGYKAAGDRERATSLMAATLADSERALGTDNPHTLSFRNNLALDHLEAGDLDRAIPLLETTLVAREWLLGTNHPDTLNSRNNLARAYQEAGDLDRAIPLYEATLAASERTLGADHSFTTAVRARLTAVRPN